MESHSRDDGNKRRKSLSQEEKPFGKSTRTTRTPRKESSAGKIDKILELRQDIKSEMNDINIDVEKMQKEQNEIKGEVKLLKHENLTL